MHRWDLLTDRHQLQVTWAGNVTGVGALKYQSPDWTPLISCLEDLSLIESILREQRDKKTDYLICRLFYKKGVM